MVKEKINKLKMLLSIFQLDGYIIPINDEYMNDFPFYNRLQYITNFTGSNGLLINLKHHNFFFTDSRYIDQSKNELDTRIFTILSIKLLKNFKWSVLIQKNSCIFGYDPKLFSKFTLTYFFNGITLKAIEENFVDKIHHDALKIKPSSQVFLYANKFTGLSYNLKIAILKKFLQEKQAQALVITSIDSICWLLNLRARDLDYSPLMLSKFLLTEKKAFLFISSDRISKRVIQQRKELIIVQEESFHNVLSQVNNSDKILIDETFASIALIKSLAQKNVVYENDPCLLMKACKNSVEISNAIKVHIKEAVVLCEFLSLISNKNWLKDKTEYDLILAIDRIRSFQEGYIMNSFATICGFQENSAIVHYNPKKSKAKLIKGKGILLVDTGAHYLGGTTDTTRTITIGKPSIKQKRIYTQILKGVIALAQIEFPIGTTGGNLDVLSRQFLWKDGKNYDHSTGHGVSNFLKVHEYPPSINNKSSTILMPGMILSNEPGFYLTGKYGIRIEDLMYVTKSKNAGYLKFVILSHVPYDPRLIDNTMLNKDEVNFLKEYYQGIFLSLKNLVTKKTQTWLSKEISLMHSTIC